MSGAALLLRAAAAADLVADEAAAARVGDAVRVSAWNGRRSPHSSSTPQQARRGVRKRAPSLGPYGSDNFAGPVPPRSKESRERSRQAGKRTVAFGHAGVTDVCSILNAEANAETKGLDIDSLYVSHIQVNQAQKGRRRTYRAHGRINAYMSCPCHVELTLSEKEAPVAKNDAKTPKLTKRQLAAIKA